MVDLGGTAIIQANRIWALPVLVSHLFQAVHQPLKQLRLLKVLFVMSGFDEVRLQYPSDAFTLAARRTQNSMKRLQYIYFGGKSSDKDVSEPYFYVFECSSKMNECKGPEPHQNKAILMIDIKSVHTNSWSAI
jgi:hypothetical protein